MSRRSRLAIVALTLAAGSALVFASPAAATFTPDGTATLSAGSNFYEGGSSGLVGACPQDTASAEIVADQPPVIVYDLTYTGDVADDTQDGVVAAGWQVPVDNAIPGTVVTFTLSCLDGASSVLATAQATAVTYDSGASISAPASAELDSTVTVSGVCADNDTVDAVVLEVVAMGTPVFSGSDTVTPGGAFSFSFPVPTDLGGGFTLAPGNDIEATAICGNSDGTYSIRSANITMTAAAAPPAPPSGGPSTLAETGSEAAVGWLLAAGLLVLGGGGLLVARRGTRSAR